MSVALFTDIPGPKRSSAHTSPLPTISACISGMPSVDVACGVTGHIVAGVPDAPDELPLTIIVTPLWICEPDLKPPRGAVAAGAEPIAAMLTCGEIAGQSRTASADAITMAARAARRLRCSRVSGGRSPSIDSPSCGASLSGGKSGETSRSRPSFIAGSISVIWLPSPCGRLARKPAGSESAKSARSASSPEGGVGGEVTAGRWPLCCRARRTSVSCQSASWATR